MSTDLAPRLKGRYKAEIAPALKAKFGYKNVMQIPTLTKVVVNMGVGEAARDSKLIEGAIRDLATITGQRPQVTRSRKSIAQFKLRENMPIGAHVTLRNDRMWEFTDRLLSIAEIEQDKIDRPRGMDITLVTSAKTDEEGRELLRALGFPFREI
jgi:large subunit ribosomal protein L5